MSNYDHIKKIIIDVFKQLLLILLYIFFSISIQLVFFKQLTSKDLYLVGLVSLLIDIVSLTILIIIFRKKIVPDWYDFKKNGKKYLWNNISYYIIGLAIMIISNIIIGSFIGIATNEEINRTIFFKITIYAVISTVIIGPIIEELLTRVILKDTFKHSFIYYILSGLIFGSLHLISANNINELFYIIPYGTLGFVFAIMHKNSNNIWTTITYHSLHNLIAILILFRSFL